ncbi:GIY-YIG nuclease family protein [Thiovibrio frasassiensis]|uniref:GIY-YIG nuclease family protein n=1 Tax=Thiovibrio frasassiensis TaxID=2984131 RepID=A0A9X4MJJ0_9BACT|nr:GIY-YIG nuclease family protein [Thiovibrio frasassiensis]MDG4476683.1 GIY-YIG nuclease family protein [Thiovibrio frasassiensis]
MTRVPPPACQSAWFVYLVRCKDETLYCGIAKNLSRRLAEHNSADKGAKYTRGRRPVQLVYSETASSRTHATQREAQIKRLSRKEKMVLIQSVVAFVQR